MDESLRRRYLEAMGIQNWVERNGAAPEPVIPQGSPEPVDPNPPDRAEPPPPVAESVPPWLQDVPPLAEEWGFSEPPEADALEPVDPVYGLDWKGLEARVAACERCELCKTRTRTVFGVGDRSADLMVIGEAPGADEDRQGEPFVGRAGQLLNAMLLAIGLERNRVFIANVLKCRPPGNRDPRPEEACIRLATTQVRDTPLVQAPRAQATCRRGSIRAELAAQDRQRFHREGYIALSLSGLPPA